MSSTDSDWRQPTDSVVSGLRRRRRLAAAARRRLTEPAPTRAPRWRRLAAPRRRWAPATRRRRRGRRSPDVRSSSWKSSSSKRNICRWANGRAWRHCWASPRRRWDIYSRCHRSVMIIFIDHIGRYTHENGLKRTIIVQCIKIGAIFHSRYQVSSSGHNQSAIEQ